MWSSESIEPGFNLSGLVARTRCGRNQSVTFEELLAATGVVWARRPAGEVTVCFKTTTAAAASSSLVHWKEQKRYVSYDLGRDGSGGSRPV